MSYESMDGYEPTSLESDIFLSDMPIGLIKENIKDQFENPMDNTNDYITNFVDTYEYSEESCEDDEDKALLQNLKNDFYSFVRSLFKEYLGIGFPDFEDRSSEEQDELMMNTYRYFIINIKKNYTRLSINFINERKNTVLELCDKKKDVTTLAYKKEISDPDILLILSNLTEIVDYILDADIDVSQFITLSMKSDDYEGEFVDKAYDDVSITGNFVKKYRKMLNAENKMDITNKVRSKILKKK